MVLMITIIRMISYKNLYILKKISTIFTVNYSKILDKNLQNSLVKQDIKLLKKFIVNKFDQKLICRTVLGT